MAKYYRKPQGPVEGIQWIGDWEKVPEWAKDEGVIKRNKDSVFVPTQAGAATAHVGDHVLRRKPGDCYVVEAENVNDLFEIKE